MAVFTKATGRMIKNMDKEHYGMPVERLMRETGKMVKNMDKELKNGQTAMFT
jgi:hypothetical protein